MTGTYCSRAVSAVSCVAVLLSAASPAAAADALDINASASDRAGRAPASEAESQALGNHQKNWRVDIGGRTQFVDSKGLDPFSKNDVIGQLTLAASYTVWTHDALSLAALVGFDYGGASANLRSDATSLDLRRFTLAPEARYHLLRLLVLTAKVGPTLTREAAEVSGGLGTSWSKTAWKFGFDATAGAAVELWGYQSGASRKPRAWLTAEGGYGWTAPMNLNFAADDSGAAPQRLAALDLGELSVAGPLFRVTAALSFW
jgi:hypothetical protein